MMSNPDIAEPLCDDKDPEQYAGEVILDPWDDPDQEDWPNETVGEGDDA